MSESSIREYDGFVDLGTDLGTTLTREDAVNVRRIVVVQSRHDSTKSAVRIIFKDGRTSVESDESMTRTAANALRVLTAEKINGFLLGREKTVQKQPVKDETSNAWLVHIQFENGVAQYFDRSSLSHHWGELPDTFASYSGAMAHTQAELVYGEDHPDVVLVIVAPVWYFQQNHLADR